jgi:glucose/mannose-6-phosphate isomerase
VNLDDLAAVAAADPGGMLGVIEGAAEQWLDAAARARATDLSGAPTHGEIAHVVVCGMGGSGIAGDVTQAICAARGAVPVTVVKGYTLPAFAREHTLVFCVSYSGNTEEALACATEAHDRRAPMIAVATGGRLGELAHEHGLPCVAPAAGLMPRAAFPYLATAPLIVLERLGLLGDLTGDLVELDSVLREQTAVCARATPAGDNPAKRLAGVLEGRLLHVWGQEGALSVAASRWRTQLNENAKMPAYSSVLPELDHNEVVGYDPGVRWLSHVAIVALRSPTEDPRITRRVEATARLVEGMVASVEHVHARGVSPLAQLASAAQLGDFTSAYLAILRGVDPSPIEPIERLKAEIS